MTGYKLAYTPDRSNTVLVELLVPDDAKVEHLKQYGLLKDFYRCDKALVKSITSFDGKELAEASSLKSSIFKYRTGEEVTARKDETLGKDVGIYFFDTKERALGYEF